VPLISLSFLDVYWLNLQHKRLVCYIDSIHIYALPNTRVFDTGESFYSSRIVVNTAGAYPSGALHSVTTLVKLSNLLSNYKQC